VPARAWAMGWRPGYGPRFAAACAPCCDPSAHRTCGSRAGPGAGPGAGGCGYAENSANAAGAPSLDDTWPARGRHGWAPQHADQPDPVRGVLFPAGRPPPGGGGGRCGSGGSLPVCEAAVVLGVPGPMQWLCGGVPSRHMQSAGPCARVEAGAITYAHASENKPNRHPTSGPTGAAV
jgi:hypothetical protein